MESSRRRGSGYWVRRGLAGAAAGGLAFGLTAGGAEAATPRYYATPACTADRPYEVDLHIADFPPNDSFRMIIGFYYEGGQFVDDYPGPDIRTDANGDADGAGITLFGDRPHRIGGLFYRDRNDNSRYDEGDDLVANLIMSIDEPCTGAEASPK